MPGKNRYKEVLEILSGPTPKNQTHGRNNWMSPLNKVIFYRAFREKRAEVQINDGRTFSINYEQRPGYAWVEHIGKEKIPCGWYDLKVVTNKSWIGS
jgi:hypothetical protein